MAVSSSYCKSDLECYEAIHNGRLETVGMDWTHLLNSKSELETAQPARQPSAAYSGPRIDNLNNHEEKRQADGDYNEKHRRTKTMICQVSSCQPVNGGLKFR